MSVNLILLFRTFLYAKPVLQNFTSQILPHALRVTMIVRIAQGRLQISALHAKTVNYLKMGHVSSLAVQDFSQLIQKIVQLVPLRVVSAAVLPPRVPTALLAIL